MTEAELCKDYITYMRSIGFRSYPETSGYDIIMTRGNLILGIQAKLQPNIKLIEQLMDSENGVDFKIALIGERPSPSYLAILYRLRFLPVFYENRFICPKPEEIKFKFNPIMYFRCSKRKPIYIPNFLPDLPAGVKSPKTVMEINVKSVQLELMSAVGGGYFSTEQARSLGLPRVPKRFFRFDFKKRLWYTHTSPGKKYPHILKGLLSNGQ